jgi:hypothetical protein
MFLNFRPLIYLGHLALYKLLYYSSSSMQTYEASNYSPLRRDALRKFA